MKHINNINKKFFYIYEITNLIDGRIYIGQHSTNNINDGYFGSGTLIDKEVNRLGKSNFKLEIIEMCKSYDQLQEREAFYVNEEVVISGKYYNLVRGGYGFGKDIGRLVMVYETFYRSIQEAADHYSLNATIVAERCKSSDPDWEDWEFHDEAIKKDPARVRNIIDPLNPHNKSRVFSHTFVKSWK